MKLSKTAQLGVIVLAVELLRQWELAAPRIVSAIAALLGVSRKSGYAAAERIRKQLSAEKESPANKALEHRVALLEIRVQVLTFERDQPEVRFGGTGKHLPAEAKSLCVRVLRDYRDRLQPGEIAAAIGAPLSSLRRWDEEADEHCRFAEKPDGRGKSRHSRAEDEERVLAAWVELERPISQPDFVQLYREKHPDRPLDPATIRKILTKHEKLQVEPAADRAPPYRDKVEIHFPGAQAAVDATECKVHFTGGEKEETVKLKEEVAIDIATGAILGMALREEEDAEGVRRVLVQARRECENLLAILADNGSANTAVDVRRVVEESSSVGSIFSFPWHPWTNGHIEGSFGQFKRIVGSIEIDDTSRDSIARSVIAIVWRIFGHFHNYSPRRRLGGKSPIEYLRSYTPRPDRIDKAKRALRKQQAKSESSREPNPRLTSEEFRQLVLAVLDEHRFLREDQLVTKDGDSDGEEFERTLRVLAPYDEAVITGANSRDLFVASKRDGFDERKRTFAYFMVIVRSKQREVDTARAQDLIDRGRTRREVERMERVERAVERERTDEIESLRDRPELVLLNAAKLLLLGQRRLRRNTLLGTIRAALGSLHRQGRNTRALMTKLTLEIESWGEHGEAHKRTLVELLRDEAEGLRQDARRAREPSAEAPVV